MNNKEQLYIFVNNSTKMPEVGADIDTQHQIIEKFS